MAKFQMDGSSASRSSHIVLSQNGSDAFDKRYQTTSTAGAMGLASSIDFQRTYTTNRRCGNSLHCSVIQA